MSDIPRARQLVVKVLESQQLTYLDRRRLNLAIRLMMRVKYCRRAPAKRQVIDKHLRKQVRLLVNTTELTMHEIANKVGLRSSGRVSDVMHGKR